jgi:hypothetical protein
MRDVEMIVIGLAITANWYDWIFPCYVGPSLDWLRQQITRFRDR